MRPGPLLLVVALGGPIPSALAQTAADRETARVLMDDGDEQLEKGAFEAALKLYLGAHEIMHVPTTGIEVARAYARMEKLVEARDAALEVLRMTAVPEEPLPFREARAAADKLARDLAPQIPLLRVEVTPPEAAQRASLSIDGGSVPRAALGFRYSLNPGEHRLRLSADGFQPSELGVVLARGERKSVRIDLEPSPVSSLRSQTARGRPSNLPTEAAANEGGLKSARPLWPLWLGAGLGGTGLVVGTVAGVVSLDRTKAAKKFCDGNDCTPAAKPDRDAALTAATVSNIGFGVAALGVALSITGWWLSRPSPPGTASTTTLRVGAEAGGGRLELDGAFW